MKNEFKIRLEHEIQLYVIYYKTTAKMKINKTIKHDQNGVSKLYYKTVVRIKIIKKNKKKQYKKKNGVQEKVRQNDAKMYNCT